MLVGSPLYSRRGRVCTPVDFSTLLSALLVVGLRRQLDTCISEILCCCVLSSCRAANLRGTFKNWHRVLLPRPGTCPSGRRVYLACTLAPRLTRALRRRRPGASLHAGAPLKPLLGVYFGTRCFYALRAARAAGACAGRLASVPRPGRGGGARACGPPWGPCARGTPVQAGTGRGGRAADGRAQVHTPDACMEAGRRGDAVDLRTSTVRARRLL